MSTCNGNKSSAEYQQTDNLYIRFKSQNPSEASKHSIVSFYYINTFSVGGDNRQQSSCNKTYNITPLFL